MADMKYEKPITSADHARWCLAHAKLIEGRVPTPEFVNRHLSKSRWHRGRSASGTGLPEVWSEGPDRDLSG